ncbi:hypothetical protein QJS83_13870 [Bdellovibrio sp. 22V]|uniref:hypothetical protein n=1 Tax=Bdellovibrio TaxID=958 RepID=UPI0025435885|nr:hypothetical protein [Bdellovibrio sp. 22V]WII71552.1 hypothetical protein QJS83_13870 [Bdellovibrio sp. 22V]
MVKRGELYDLDIRDCLENLIKVKKKRNPRFSQRAFANLLGFSVSTFNEILKGKRRISRKSIEKIEKGLFDDQDLRAYISECTKASFLRCSASDGQGVLATTQFFETLVLAMDPSEFELIRSRIMNIIEESKDFLHRDEAKRQDVYLLSFGCGPLTNKKAA